MSPLVQAMASHPPPGLREIVPAFNTLLLEFSNRPAADAAATWLTSMSLAGGNAATAVPPESSRPVIQLPIQFDGPDLAELADRKSVV